VFQHDKVRRLAKPGNDGGKRKARPGKPEEREMSEWRIVDDITWFAVQAKMAERRGDRKAPGPGTKHPLSGVARCTCGYAITVIRAYRRGKGWEPAYGCSAHKERGKAVCPVDFVQPKSEVEAAMVDFTSSATSSPPPCSRS
jgi:hypothetical protein